MAVEHSARGRCPRFCLRGRGAIQALVVLGTLIAMRKRWLSPPVVGLVGAGLLLLAVTDLVPPFGASLRPADPTWPLRHEHAHFFVLQGVVLLVACIVEFAKERSQQKDPTWLTRRGATPGLDGNQSRGAASDQLAPPAADQLASPHPVARRLTVGFPECTPMPSGSDAHQIERHLQGVDQAHAGAWNRCPRQGDLGHGQVEAIGDRVHLDVEGESVALQERKDAIGSCRRNALNPHWVSSKCVPTRTRTIALEHCAITARILVPPSVTDAAAYATRSRCRHRREHGGEARGHRGRRPGRRP